MVAGEVAVVGVLLVVLGVVAVWLLVVGVVVAVEGVEVVDVVGVVGAAGHCCWARLAMLVATWATVLLSVGSTPERLLADPLRFEVAVATAGQLRANSAEETEFS